MALRAAWRALVLTGHDAGELLDGLDKVLSRDRQSEELFATVCCCWISPGRDRITVALAGHPPPLLARAGRVEAVEVPGGPALGIYDQPYPWEAGQLEADGPWTLLCYTDGLVEGRSAPGSVERFGIDALEATVAELLGEHGRAPGDARPAARRRPPGQRRRPVGRPGHPLPVPRRRRAPAMAEPAPSRPGSPCPAAPPASGRPAASSRPGPRPGRSRRRWPTSWC